MIIPGQMVRCIDCGFLHIRTKSSSTYFCLVKGDYLQDIDTETECKRFMVIAGKNVSLNN